MTTGLILVDIQNDYFPGGAMELVGMDAAARNAARLLGSFREKRLPTFHVQHIAIKESATFFLPRTPGAALHESIRPQAGEPVIQKHFPNSFRETALHRSLEGATVDTVVICGAMSHMCIDATARAAVDLGYGCIVVHDACATRNLEFMGRVLPADAVHASFMAALGSSYARLTDTDGCLAILA